MLDPSHQWHWLLEEASFLPRQTATVAIQGGGEYSRLIPLNG